MHQTKDGRRLHTKTFQCPVCEGDLFQPAITKFNIDYLSCKNCEVLFSDEIDPTIIITHNNAPEERADVKAQNTRLQRVIQHLGRKPDQILDFGCGRGDYVNFLNRLGFRAVGVDQETDLKLSDVSTESMDVINMVEVIEHLGDPRSILQQLTDILKPRGIIYMESSFVDFIDHPLTSDYVDPRIGHCCIHSRKSIELLSEKLKLRPTWINNNVVILHKGHI